jgi:hypothetical protein
MSHAASSQQAGTPQGQADARRAADRLNQATQSLSGIRAGQSKNQIEDLANQADSLAKKQQDFEGQMRRAFGPQGKDLTREQAAQLASQKDAEVNDLKKLSSGMQTAARDLQATERAASTKMREALSGIQQSEMERDMQRNADYIRRGLGEYAVMSESNFTQGLNEVRDQLKQVQQALGSGGADPKNAQQDRATQQGLANLEGLRQMLQQQAGGRGQGQQGQPQGQPGQGRQGQQGQGQPGQGQQGQGQQGQGQPGQGQQQGQGQQGQPGQGQQGGGQQGGGGQLGGGGTGGAYNGGANYGGNYGGPGVVNPQARLGDLQVPDYQTQYRNTLQSLQQLQQQYRNDPATAHDIGQLIQQLRQLDPYTYANDPMLSQRIQAAILPAAEQVEMELRRKVEETGGSVRSPGTEKVPPGYSGATAEYFKKLSKDK